MIKANLTLNGGGGLLCLKALDFGCGIGRQSMLINEFKIQSFGIDISENAINQAKKLCKTLKTEVDFRVFDGEKIPFEDGFFDFAISYGVLDSMPFTLAQNCIMELNRVVKKYCFITLIGENSASLFTSFNSENFTDEIEVRDAHEFGTIQSFFDKKKIKKLIQCSNFKIKFAQKLTHTNLLDHTAYSRYFVVLEKEK